MRAIKGYTEFYSETGTEGGHWAFYDPSVDKIASPTYGVTHGEVWDATNPKRKGRVYEDTVEVLRDGRWDPLPDPMQSDPDYVLSSLFRGEKRGDRDADARLAAEYGFIIKYASDQMNERYGEGNWTLEDETTAVGLDGVRYFYGGTPTTEPNRPYGVSANQLTRATIEWEDGETELRMSDSLLVRHGSYSGLHVLADGDKLTIFDREDPHKILWSGTIKLIPHRAFTQSAHGLWIHADQEGIDRSTWAEMFMTSHPAELKSKRFRRRRR